MPVAVYLCINRAKCMVEIYIKKKRERIHEVETSFIHICFA